MPARVVALYNDKGSTGKTTLALAVAAAVVRAGATVRLLDADRAGDAAAVAAGWAGVTAQAWTPRWTVGEEDLVLIDCRASDEPPAALERADLVVVPVWCEPLAVRRLAQLLPALSTRPFAVVVNAYYAGPDTDETMRTLTDLLGDQLWRPPIPRRVAFPKAQKVRVPVQEFRGRPPEVLEATAALATRMLTWAPTS